MRLLKIFIFILLPIFLVGQGTGQPNVIVIIADDLGHNDVNLYNSPGWDFMTANGRVFDNFYTTPICSPSRIGFLTGIYSQHLGIGRALQCAAKNQANNSGYFDDVKSIGESFNDCNYRTDYIGKWHMGHQSGDRPEDEGFEYGYYTTQSGINYTTRIDGCGDYEWDKYENGTLTLDQPFKHNSYVTYDITEDAIERIDLHEANGDQFYIQVAYTSPHTPIQDPNGGGNYGLLVEAMEQGVMDIINAVDDLESTIILYWSDNGGLIGAGGSNVPLRDGKTTSFEGGVNSPAVVMWKNHIDVGVMTEDITHMDLYPTLIDLVGCVQPSGVDGKSAIRGLFCSDHQVETRFELESHCTRYSFPPNRNNCAYWDTQGYKYVWDRLTNEEFVFDLNADPNETTDLSSDIDLLTRLQSEYLVCEAQNLTN